MKKTNTNEKSPSEVNESSSPLDTSSGQRILFALRRIIRAVDMHSRMLAMEYQITGPQLACLLAVVNNESITATEIGKRISLSTSTIIGILDRLEGKGMLRRERDVNDRRVIHVYATEEGKKQAADMPYPLKQPLNKALSMITETEQETIATSLELLVKLMGADAVSTDTLIEIIRIDEFASDK